MAMMTLSTPHAANHTELSERASRYVDVESLPWQNTPFPGIQVKILMEDSATGMLTSLTRFDPGAELPLHEHVGLEQTFVLEGYLEDDEGTAHTGNYVWRPAGSRHTARAPEGCLALGIFQKPNKFL